MTYTQTAWALRGKDGWWWCPKSRKLTVENLHGHKYDYNGLRLPGDRVVRVRVTMEVEE